MEIAANIQGSNNISQPIVTKIPSYMQCYNPICRKFRNTINVFLKEYSDEPVHLRTQFVKILLDKVAQSWRKVRQSRSYFFKPTVLPKNEQMNSILLL